MITAPLWLAILVISIVVVITHLVTSWRNRENNASLARLKRGIDKSYYEYEYRTELHALEQENNRLRGMIALDPDAIEYVVLKGEKLHKEAAK